MPASDDAMAEFAARLRERAATAHERTACPRCRAPEGERCRRMPVGFDPVSASHGAPLLHSHAERLRADGIPPR